MAFGAPVGSFVASLRCSGSRLVFLFSDLVGFLHCNDLVEGGKSMEGECLIGSHSLTGEGVEIRSFRAARGQSCDWALVRRQCPIAVLSISWW